MTQSTTVEIGHMKNKTFVQIDIDDNTNEIDGTDQREDLKVPNELPKSLKNTNASNNSFEFYLDRIPGSPYPLKPEVFPGGLDWVTEEEADTDLVKELGVGQMAAMASAVTFQKNGNMDFLICTMCKTGIVTGNKLLNELHTSDREMKSLMIYICIQFNLFPKHVCRGMINLVGDEILFILKKTKNSPSQVCGMFLPQQCSDSPLPPWTIKLPTPSVKTPEPLTSPKTRGKVKILHVTDLHVDDEYEEGSDVNCPYPLCCRKTSNWNKPGNMTPVARLARNVIGGSNDHTGVGDPAWIPEVAGKWGSFGHCDIPKRTLSKLLQEAAMQNPDLVYVTGDFPAHDIWNQTRKSIVDSISQASKMIKEAFPNTPIVMAVGNHDIAPSNSFPVNSVNEIGYNPRWLYKNLEKIWSDWVPLSSRESLVRGGYYSVSPMPGLRVISMNGNDCHSLNWWLLIEHKDSSGQIEWLIEELEKAKIKKERVHIVTHVPPGSYDCEPNWSKHFAHILARYADLIAGVFSGHLHHDHWQIFYDPLNAQRPVGMTYITPSATTFSLQNPSFRIFHVDGTGDAPTWAVTDYDTFSSNITEANLPGGNLNFQLQYSAKEAYGIPDLSPASWANLTQRMTTNTTLFNEHLRFRYNYWSSPEEIKHCNKVCRRKILCNLLRGDNSNRKPCRHLWKKEK